MATKIRLQRHGKKRAAFYHVVIADERAKRDGKFIEKIGTYNPNTDPATIDLKFDRALYWVKVGAQPTDTARAILSYKGVLLKNHLDKGVAKGALTQEEADKKFEAWMKDKEAKIEGKAESITKAKEEAAAAQLAIESEQREARAKEIAAKAAPPVEEGVETSEEDGEKVVTEEAPVEEVPATEEAPSEEEKKEEPVAEAEEAKEAPAEEGKKKEEAAPAKEPKTEEDATKEEK